MENKEETVRLFVSVDIPDNYELRKICKNFWEQKFFFGRCTKAENFHLTLKFLGDVSEDRIPEIDAALKRVSFPIFEAHLGKLGVLPSRQQIRILFTHVVCAQLSILAKQIEDVLDPLFERENRELKSHVTIARIKTVKKKEQFLRAVDETEISDLPWKVDSFVLKKSTLTEDGPIYETVARYKLAE